MKTEFEVKSLFVGEMEDMNCFAAIFCEAEDGEGQRLEIQKGIEFDSQDVDLGQDTYCIGIESGATVYGGVVGCELEGNNLRIELSHEAASVLEVKGFHLRLQKGADASRVAEGLKRIFETDRLCPEKLVLKT